ncbi:hypothetical protein LNJ08_05190 [Tenacibaculum finnmarkense genomovar ulcerans]|uniref:hypothetical protein n=1 Tax=Tenacibaculum finnmarkense TaxID=2781243 RepID=UPI001E5BC876|nr:hypothetical protein [Tenacibaculum finnmarkense]MCD8453780.1 hypothetical protein [Tenacibaculum finnmarkense genomovar ulcerans]
MDLNYTEIVLNGYLDNCFFRQFKKAQKDFYEADEFFNGCFRVTRFFEAEMNKRIIERITELYLIIDWHKRGMRGASCIRFTDIKKYVIKLCFNYHLML